MCSRVCGGFAFYIWVCGVWFVFIFVVVVVWCFNIYFNIYVFVWLGVWGTIGFLFHKLMVMSPSSINNIYICNASGGLKSN